MPSAIAYIRFSTVEQGSEGKDSLRRQRELAKAVAVRRGLTIVRWIEDLGLSAYKGAHIETGSFGRFLDEVRDGQIGAGTHFLFENFDRLSRLPFGATNRIILDLFEADLTLITTSDDTVYREDQGLLGILRPLLEGERGHSESKAKSGRIRDVWSAKRQRAMSGEKLTSRIHPWLRAVKDERGRIARFEVIPERAAIVQQVWEDMANGMGKFIITRRLNDRRVPTWNGGDAWQMSSVQKIMNSRAVIGEFQPHQLTATKFNAKTRKRTGGKREPVGDTIPNYFPTVIERSLFDRALAAKAQRKGKGGRTGSIRNLFSGVCRCWACDGNMTFRNHGNGGKAGRPYLICDRAIRHGGCDNNSHHVYHDIECAILSSLGDLLFDPADLQSRSEAIRAIETEAATLAQQRAAKEKEIKRLINAVASGTNPYVAEAIDLRGREIDQMKEVEKVAKRRLEECRGKLGSPERIQLLETLRVDMASDDENLRFAARARIAQEIKSVITKIIFEPGGFMIEVGGGLRLYDFGTDGRLRALHLDDHRAKGEKQQRLVGRIERIRAAAVAQ